MGQKTIYLCDGCGVNLGDSRSNWVVGRVVMLEKDVKSEYRNASRVTTNSDQTTAVVNMVGPYQSDPAGGHGDYDHMQLEFCQGCARRLLVVLEKLADKKEPEKKHQCRECAPD